MDINQDEPRIDWDNPNISREDPHVQYLMRHQLPRYFVGLDLGQSADYTALTILHRLGPVPRANYDMVHLERYKLGTSYPTIVEDVTSKLLRAPLLGSSVWLAIDATGVGAPVVDMFKRAKPRAQLCPVMITGGDVVTRDGGVTRVPKRQLVSVVQVNLQQRRLRVPPNLPLAQTLVSELQNFQVKINPDTAHDSYGAWREGTHDDIVLATSLALWTAFYGSTGARIIEWRLR